MQSPGLPGSRNLLTEVWTHKYINGTVAADICEPTGRETRRKKKKEKRRKKKEKKKEEKKEEEKRREKRRRKKKEKKKKKKRRSRSRRRKKERRVCFRIKVGFLAVRAPYRRLFTKLFDIVQQQQPYTPG